MITAQEIRAAIADLLKNKAGLPYEVHFNNNKESSKSYFFVTITSRRKTFDRVYYERFLTVDCQLRLLPDEFNTIRRTELYSAADALDTAICPVIKIKDRHVTVLNTRSRIVDDILHYEFDLDFADYLPIEVQPFMEELNLNLSVKNISLELKEESEDA